MSRTWIGLLGGTGEVGRAALATLGGLGSVGIRLGARSPTIERSFACRAPLELVPVNLFDADSLAQFVSGCAVVVNCAGPSYRVGDRVARASLAAGAHYVDVAGDDPVYESLTQSGLPEGRAVVLSAGVLPGLSTLLPRWFAETELDRVTRLVVYAGGLERGTVSAAADFLLSLDNGFGMAGGAWRNGAVIPRALAPSVDVELAFFPGPVAVQPFLSTEAQRLALDLGLSELDWFNVLSGQHLRAELSRLRGTSWKLASDAELSTASERLVAAAAIDLAGRTPYHHMVFQFEGFVGRQQCRRTVVLRLTDSYHLTGTLGALSAKGILTGEVKAGVHYASEVLNRPETMAALHRASAIAGLATFEDVGARDAVLEEGVL